MNHWDEKMVRMLILYSPSITTSGMGAEDLVQFNRGYLKSKNISRFNYSKYIVRRSGEYLAWIDRNAKWRRITSPRMKNAMKAAAWPHKVLP